MDGYKIKSKEQFLNEIVKLQEENLQLCIHPANKASAYRRYEKKKKNGYRTIYSIDKNNLLYIAQNNLQNNLFQNFMFPECVYGFRKRRSYYDYLMPHISEAGPRFFIRLDISNFFDTIRMKDIQEALEYYIIDEIDLEERNYIIKNLIEITTINNGIVQGAVTSSVLSNLVFRSLDIRIERYCKKINVVYSRYADDMLFSSDKDYIHSNKFINMIRKIIRDKGFLVNNSKTIRDKNEIHLNGFVVGTDIRMSRKKLSGINKIIYEMEKKDFTGFDSRKLKYSTRNKLSGYRAYLIQILKYTKNENKTEYITKKIKKIEKLILDYCIE